MLLKIIGSSSIFVAGIEDLGKRITLMITDPTDLSRDVLQVMWRGKCEPLMREQEIHMDIVIALTNYLIYKLNILSTKSQKRYC